MKKTILIIIIALSVVILSNNKEQIEIPSTSIRMRVIAKSNSIKDQSDKIKIKKALEEKLNTLTKNITSYEEVNNLIEENQEEINDYLKLIAEKEKIDTTITSNYGYNYFPEKEYKGLIYKAGNYKSFVVTLDEGKGDNWWCVLYPPICLIDEKQDTYEYHYLIKDILSKYN